MQKVGTFAADNTVVVGRQTPGARQQQNDLHGAQAVEFGREVGFVTLNDRIGLCYECRRFVNNWQSGVYRS